MNKTDRDNLEYLMSLNEKEFDKWMNSSDQEDIDYAIELLRRKRSENLLEEMDLMESTMKDDHTTAKSLIDDIRNKSTM